MGFQADKSNDKEMPIRPRLLARRYEIVLNMFKIKLIFQGTPLQLIKLDKTLV